MKRRKGKQSGWAVPALVVACAGLAVLYPRNGAAEASGPGDPMYTIMTVNIDGVETQVDSRTTTEVTKYATETSTVTVTSSPVDYDYELDGGRFAVNPAYQASSWDKDGFGLEERAWPAPSSRGGI